MKAYPEYKDSGVEWLGEVPAGWEVSRFKNHLHERDERSEDGDETLLSVSAYTGVRPRSEGIEDGEFLSRAESLQGYKVAYSGDLVMNIMLAWNRAQGITDFNGIVSPAYAVFKLNSSIFPAYLNHLVRTDEYCRYFKAFSAGVIDSRLRLYPEKFGGLFAIIPPLSEQRKIAAFLDREVAKIDDLIEEQRRLIALLAEKRQATISHAVTKGLNPNAKLKPSGIDWLGDVPEGWEVVTVKRVIKHLTSGPRGWGDLLGGQEAMFFQSQNIGRDMEISTSEAARLDPPSDNDASRSKLENGDVVVCITGGRTGAVAHVQGLYDEAYVNQHVCLLRPDDTSIIGRFLAYTLFSGSGQEQLLAGMYGLKQGLGLEQLRNQVIALPSLDEQCEIISALDSDGEQSSSLSTFAVQAITLLQERRSALISAAVTGKIDLRDFDDSILE